MREGFLLDPEVVHLNHGSFGACPLPVFEDYQRLQRELQRAITRTWEFVGAELVVCEPDEILERIGPRTRAVSVSHLTSPTALLLPVAVICAAAREAGALAIVDGAHAPGHILLDLESVGADIYAGNCQECR